MPVSKRTIQRFFRLIRAVLALKEECREPFHGAIECDETTFGGRRNGKRGWGVVEPRGAAILTAEKGSGVMPRIGFIHIEECRGNFSIFFLERFLSGSIIVRRTYSP